MICCLGIVLIYFGYVEDVVKMGYILIIVDVSLWVYEG